MQKKPRPNTKRRAADKKPVKKVSKVKKTPIDRRKGSELQGFIDLVMTNLLNQYHYGLLQQAFEQGYTKGLADGLKEGMNAADAQTNVSLHELKTFLRETDEVGIKVRKDDTLGKMTEREKEFLGE